MSVLQKIEKPLNDVSTKIASSKIGIGIMVIMFYFDCLLPPAGRNLPGPLLAATFIKVEISYGVTTENIAKT